MRWRYCVSSRRLSTPREGQARVIKRYQANAEVKAVLDALSIPPGNPILSVRRTAA